jgi:tetratricopeptide (TPR) repeat protein
MKISQKLYLIHSLQEISMSKLFISASSKDDAFVKQVVKAVEAIGHETFYYKKDIRTSDTWPMREAKGLDWADYIICFVSESFLSSRYCTDEMAVGYAKDNLITVKIEPCMLPGQFAARNYLLDLSSELSRRQEVVAIKRFSEALKAFFKGSFDSFEKTPEPLFRKNELGVVFATFKQVSGTKLSPAEDWLMSVRQRFGIQVKKLNVRMLNADKVISTEDEAKLYLTRSGAGLVIWGSVSALNRVEINCTAQDKYSWALPKTIYMQGIQDARKSDEKFGLVSLRSFQAYLSDGNDIDYIVNVFLGMSHQLKGKHKEALNLFVQALKIASLKRAMVLRTDSLLYLMGMACGEQSKFELAIKYLTDSIKLNPKYPLSYFNRGVCYYAIRDYKNAIADYGKVIALKSKIMRKP